MEHRWGTRIEVTVPVRLTTANPLWVRNGQLSSVSVSGGWVTSDVTLRMLARVHVILESPAQPKHHAPTIAAYVARKHKDGIGLEWCEFAPPPILQLLQAVTSRPYTRIVRGDHDLAAGGRGAQPLLKHRR